MKEKRFPWIDNIRTLAVFCVVLCHCVDSNYYWVIFGLTDPPSLQSWLFQTAAFLLGRMGVPLFLMLSGRLLLSKSREPAKFYRHSLLPLLATCEIWIVIYYFFSLRLNQTSFDLGEFIDWILLFKNTTFNHTWYLYTILGIYLAVPFLAVVVKTFSLRQMALPLIVVFFANFIFPIYNIFAGEINSSLHDVSTMLDLSFLGGTYGFYLIFGYYVGNGASFINKIKSRFLAAVFAISFLSCIALEYYLYSNSYFHSDALLWYQSPFILVCSLCIFELIRRLKFQHRACTFLAKISFGIYLLHNLFLTSFNLYAGKTDFSQQHGILFRTGSRFVITFFGSLILVSIFYLLPFKKFKKLILYIKS